MAKKGNSKPQVNDGRKKRGRPPKRKDTPSQRTRCVMARFSEEEYAILHQLLLTRNAACDGHINMAQFVREKAVRDDRARELRNLNLLLNSLIQEAKRLDDFLSGGVKISGTLFVTMTEGLRSDMRLVLTAVKGVLDYDVK